MEHEPVSGVPRWPGWVAGVADAALGSRLSILIFHRVLPRTDPLFPEEIEASRFRQLMTLVARNFTVLTLGRAVALMEVDRLPGRPLVITFDDGYADNAEVALPILRELGLVATFFVSTGFLDGGRMWNDTVIESLRRTSFERVDLDSFGLEAVAVTGSHSRRAAIHALLQRVKYMSLAQREEALARLRLATGSPELPDDLMMRSDQVIALHRAGMEIGGHTVHHPILTKLPDAQAEDEIFGGRRALQSLVDAPIDVFAYPNGQPGRDYDARHVAMVRQAGFRGAVSTATGVACAGADLLQMPRFTPWDRSLQRWAGRLMWHRLRAPAYRTAG